jgi:hypothetical protein
MISPREESGQEPVGSEGGKDAATVNLDLWLRQVRVELRSLIEGVRRTAFVEFQRMHLKAVDGLFRGTLYLCLVIGGVALTINAILLLVSGTRGVLAATTKTPWLADLCTGLLFLSIFWFGGLAIRTMIRQHILRSTERRLGAGPASQAPVERPGETR